MRTVGEILKKARFEKHLSLEEVEKTLRIRKKFLEALETNRWSDLPSLPYIKGFLKNYSVFLGLLPDEILAVFRRQFSEKEEIKVLPQKLKGDSLPFSLRITPQIVTITLITAFLTLFFGYLFSQYRAYTSPPDLTIDRPQEGEIVKSKDIQVSGKTDSDVVLSVNDQKIALEGNGEFKTTLTLTPGINTIIIQSVRKNGKKHTITRIVSYQENNNP
ncbi:hypothetical protein A3D77_03665 [Candidatus Gottesmanbacteria bacterium RIFCSPHIGHO2_02_FULL_39_11]|uniref:HTH cro/C1-type domain-containing protein n=1 Tax=Candidatus Gottesmanbacteria bacterium RIFCSPHIGHO2_02_FULL_39_11 TaxID=1798382 RepID=A0A1F5ZY80_9BACT|nr:MAG: hypothetical protein A3D77_03665 [Candidatus Gottesmanbacteria bacterium RIFCSPHIGHO2_02_FULL_39_11]